MKILALTDNDKRQVKRMQDKIKRIRKKRKQDERKAIDDVDALQHKIRDIKFKDADKPIETEQEAAKMNQLKKEAIRSRANARLEVMAADSDEEFQPRVMPNDKEESKTFKIPLWYFHYVKKVAGINLDRPSAFDILRYKPNIAVKILMQVPQFNAMARNQHKEEAINWNRKADKYEAAYNALVAKAEKALKAEGKEMGPLISGIVSDNFPTAVKDRLRFLIRAKQKYRDIARIHEAAVKSRLTL